MNGFVKDVDYFLASAFRKLGPCVEPVKTLLKRLRLLAGPGRFRLSMRGFLGEISTL